MVRRGVGRFMIHDMTVSRSPSSDSGAQPMSEPLLSDGAGQVWNSEMKVFSKMPATLTAVVSSTAANYYRNIEHINFLWNHIS